MAIIQHRRDTSAALANQTAAAGEIFFETDTNRMKVGDGITKHSDLPYLDNEIVLSEVEGLVEQLAGKAPVSHNHPIEDIDGLRAELDGKADATHGQSLANLDRTGAIDGQVVTWSDTLGKWVPSGQSIAAGSFDGGTVSNAVHAPDGSESTPAYSFTSNTGSGMFVAADGSIRLAAGQTVGLAIDLDGRVSLPQGLALSNLTPDGSSTDTYYFVSYQGRFYSIPSAGAYKAYGQTISNGNDPSAADIFDTYAVAESFAMSGDGMRVVIGVPLNQGSSNRDTGELRIYDFDESAQSWVLSETILGQEYSPAIQGFDGERLGKSAHISGDGTVIAAAVTIGDGGYGPGNKPIRVYELAAGGSWQERPNPPNQIGVTSTFALSRDGNKIAYSYLSDPANNLYSVRVAQWSGSSWVDDGSGADLLANVASWMNSGSSIAFSEDGNAIAVGVASNNAVSVFRKTGSAWAKVGNDLTGPANSLMGRHCAIAKTANELIVATFYDTYVFGPDNTAAIFRCPTGSSTWTLVQEITNSSLHSAGATAGYIGQVALSDDGTMLAIQDFFLDPTIFPTDHDGSITVLKTDSLSSPSYYVKHNIYSPLRYAQSVITQSRFLFQQESPLAISGDFERVAFMLYNTAYGATGQQLLYTLLNVPGPVVTISSLTDVADTPPSDGDGLIWDAAASAWSPGVVNSLSTTWPAGPYTAGTVAAEIDSKLPSDASWTATDSTSFLGFRTTSGHTLCVGPRVNGADTTPLAVFEINYGATVNSSDWYRLSGSASGAVFNSSNGMSFWTCYNSGVTAFSQRIQVARSVHVIETDNSAYGLLTSTTTDPSLDSRLYLQRKRNAAGTDPLLAGDEIGKVVFRATTNTGALDDSGWIAAHATANATSLGTPLALDVVLADSSGTNRVVQQLDGDGNALTRIKGESSGGVAASALWPAFACRAFAQITDTGGSAGASAAIRHSENFSSITSLGLGFTRFTFETAMPDDAYAIVIGNRIARNTTTGGLNHAEIAGPDEYFNPPTTTSFVLAHIHFNNGNFLLQGNVRLSVAVFR